jgi:hypothetical protein
VPIFSKNYPAVTRQDLRQFVQSEKLEFSNGVDNFDFSLQSCKYFANLQ